MRSTPADQSSTQSPRIAFIGLGNMGGRIAQRIGGTYAVVGFDTDPSRAGARSIPSASTIAGAVDQGDIVMLSLPDSSVVEAVMRADDGVLTACRAGQIVVDLSTSSPGSTVALAQELAEKGVEMIDAGISGGAAAAEQGTLTIMAGGSPAALAEIQPVLDTFATNVCHMGASGSGHTTKILNFLNGVSLAATAEVMVAARKAGLDLHAFLDVVNASSGVNFATLNRFPKIVDGDYLEGGLTNRLMMKDVSLYVDLLSALGSSSLNAAGPLASFGLAIGLGYGDVISNRVVDALGDVSGGVRLHETKA